MLINIADSQQCMIVNRRKIVDIKEIRGKTSQKEFAKLLGVTPQTVSNWETGRTRPTKPQQDKILRLRNKKSKVVGYSTGNKKTQRRSLTKKVTVASRIKQKRLSSGWNQQQVSERIKVSQSTFSNWENGKTRPNKQQMVELEELLGPIKGLSQNEEQPLDSSPFGAWLTTTRTNNKMTVAELAQKAGVSVPTIYNIESGKNQNPQESTREKISIGLGEIPPEDTIIATEDAASIQGLGNLIDFDPFDVDSRPVGPGIYVFYDISQRPIYVGESKEMKRRIKDHEDKFWFKAPIVQTGSFITIVDNDMRQKVEKILIKFLKSNAVINRQNVNR